MKKVTILIIDDKPANIFTLEKLLETSDRSFLTATSGKAGLALALNNDIDLLILDVQMPDMDGFEVAQIIKSGKQTKDIPIIFASAEKTERAAMMKGFDEGAIDYLSKPLDPEITKAKVAVLLQIQRQKKELVEKNFILERSALLINNSADIIGIMDPVTFRFEQVNEAFATILGYAEEETRDIEISFFLSPPEMDVIKNLVKSDKERLSFETRVFTKNKAVKWLHWHVSVKGGKWFVNARDVTEIQQLNNDLRSNLKQLESANKELESFSYSVSHDLRAPLRVLEGYSSIMLEDFSEKLDIEGKRLLNGISQNARNMNNLIDDLLRFSKLGRKNIDKTKIDINALVQRIVTETKDSTPHQARVTVHPLMPVKADEALLAQVWTNLISNAIKYSAKKESPVIEIGCYKTDTEIIFHVKDNGAGFDMQFADRLFGVFQRLHKARDFEGTGVGLAIAQKIITRHGGRIWAEAKIEEGACFYFSLPANE